MRRLALTCIGILCVGLSATADETPDWVHWGFLTGDWVADSQPGGPTGGFSFKPELQERILVRKNRADYPATKDRPASSHDDLMVVYAEGGETRAIYFDNEGHVIRYKTAFSEDGKQVVFTSDAAPGAPGFRLTYREAKPGKLSFRFEIAPPGQAFASYIQGSLHRK